LECKCYNPIALGGYYARSKEEFKLRRRRGAGGASLAPLLDRGQHLLPRLRTLHMRPPHSRHSALCPCLEALWVRKTPCGFPAGTMSFLEALTYQDPDEAPCKEDGLSTLDIVPHPVPPNGHFGCGQSCNDEFVGSLDAVEGHERTCVQLLSFCPQNLWLREALCPTRDLWCSLATPFTFR